MSQIITLDPSTTRLSVAYVITELRNRGWKNLADNLFKAYETHYGSGRVDESTMIAGNRLRLAILLEVQSRPRKEDNTDMSRSLYKEIVEGCQKRIPATWGW
jgi:ribosomal protein L18